jgi:hypothetical protein
MDTDSTLEKVVTDYLYLAVIDRYASAPHATRSPSALLLAANTAIAPKAAAALRERLLKESERIGPPVQIELDLLEMHAHGASTDDILKGLETLGLRPATLRDMLEVLADHLYLMESTPPYPCLAGLRIGKPGGPVPILSEDRPRLLLDLVSRLADPWEGHFMIFGSRL